MNSVAVQLVDWLVEPSAVTAGTQTSLISRSRSIRYSCEVIGVS